MTASPFPTYLQSSAQEAELAQSAQKALLAVLDPQRPLVLRVAGTDRDHVIELPTRAVMVLLDVLTALAAGQNQATILERAELTTVQAAAVLNVSRPFLIKLLDTGEIPYRKVGTHRRIRVADVLEYREQNRHEREAALDELVRDAQLHQMGYEKA